MRVDDLSSISSLLLIYICSKSRLRTWKLRKNVITQTLISRQLFSVGVRNSICTFNGLLPHPSLYPLQSDRHHILGVLLA